MPIPECLASNPVRRAVRVESIPGSCDSHAHVFGPATLYPYHPERRYTPPDATVENYLSTLTALGFDRGVLVQPSVYRHANSCLLAGLRAAPDRLRGVVTLDPARIDKTMLASMADAGVCGIRVNAAAAQFTHELLARLADVAASLRWHIDLQVRGIEQTAELAPILRRLRAPVAIEAMGKIRSDMNPADAMLRPLMDMLADGTVWVKLSHAYKLSSGGIPYRDTTWIARALVAARPDRVLWGSDWPHPRTDPMPDDEDLVDLIGEWIPDRAQRRAVLVDNPAVFYGFAPYPA